ncbi:MAG: hypothetical protein ACJ75B_13060 [Flavisolibacter sp.]
MRLTKLKMFFLLNGGIAFCLVFYFSLWIFGGKATAEIISPYYTNQVDVKYLVGTKVYSSTYLRNDVPYNQRKISIRYLSFHPQSSRIDSFMGIYFEPLAWWSVFLLASAMLLLTDNLVFSRGTMFGIGKNFPWISMEEYFPVDDVDSEVRGNAYQKEKINKPKQLEN